MESSLTLGSLAICMALCGCLLRPLLAAAAAERAAPVESAAFRLSPRLVVAVVPLLTEVAAVESAFVLVLVVAAAPGAELATPATPSVVVVESALIAVAVATPCLPHERKDGK